MARFIKGALTLLYYIVIFSIVFIITVKAKPYLGNADDSLKLISVLMFIFGANVAITITAIDKLKLKIKKSEGKLESNSIVSKTDWAMEVYGAMKEAAKEKIWVLFEIIIGILILISSHISTMYNRAPEDILSIIRDTHVFLFNYLLAIVMIKYILLFIVSFILNFIPKNNVLKQTLYDLADTLEKVREGFKERIKEVIKIQKERALQKSKAKNKS